MWGTPTIYIAVALGQYGKLEHWAREQAIEALEWKQELPDLFPEATIHGHRINEIVYSQDHQRQLKSRIGHSKNAS